MKKVKRIGVIYDPLNISASLLVRGGSLSQTHCAERSEFVPDRELTPLVIVPQVYIQDPNKVLTSGYVRLSGVLWYALPKDIADTIVDESYLSKELAQYVITAGTQGYSVAEDGTLTVSTNVPYLSPVVLVFTGNYADPRDGKILRIHATATLSTSSVVLPATLSLDKPTSWGFNPISDSGTRSVVATLRIGGVVPDAAYKVRYWWYKVKGGVESLIDEGEDLFYESGQNSDTLTIDPRYIDGAMHLICKAEYVLAAESLPNSPTAECLTAETVIARRYPNYDFENFVHGGVDVAAGAEVVKNECVVTIGREVLEHPAEHFTIRWSIKRTVYGAEWQHLGFGESIYIPADEFADGADVGLEVEEFSALGAMADGDTVLCDGDAVITF